MRTILSIAVATLTLGGAAHAQHHGHAAASSPYATLQSRDIKALSPEQSKQLLEGQGMSLALAAELNGYPGPSHVLEHADALQLDAAQRERTQALMQAHKTQARAIGAAIVEAERELDRAFAQRTIDAPELARRTARIGALQGELRAEHLRTHLAQTELLTPQQVAQYQRLRGYATQGDRQ